LIRVYVVGIVVIRGIIVAPVRFATAIVARGGTA
jgi:hypothetical protein